MSRSVGSTSVEVVPSAEGFREKLDVLLRNLPSVKVVLETTEAEAKIDELRARLLGIHDKTIDVRVDDHGTANNVSNNLRGINAAASFAQAGVALKVAGIVSAIAAIIPIAAAATLAVAGIGLGLLVGGLGVIVGALALSGVGGAVSAGNTANGGGGGASRAQALDNQRQAEVALAAAQRNATAAQLALTQARIDAVQALQSLSNEVTDNGLAQRQAVLDLQTARQNLATANANPDASNPANAGALAQVQLQFDQAKQNLLELQETGQQLATQQTTANAAGISGAANVVAAQNQVIDTQNALVEAQFQASTSAAAAAAGAGAYGAALAKLDPAQQAFAEFLQSIKPLLDTLKSAAASSFLPLLQQAIQDLLPLVGPLSQILTTLGTAFGQLAVTAATALTGPFWTQFLTFLNTTLGPDIQTFGEIFGGLFTAGASAFQALSPLLLQIGGTFATVLGSLATAIQGGSLNGFITYLQQNLPQIGSTLTSVFGAVSSVLSALAPSAGPALQIIQQLADGIAQLAPVVGPLVTLFLQLVNSALKPLIPQLVQLAKQLFPPLVTLIDAIVPIAGLLVGAVLDLVTAFVPLIPVFSQLITELLPPLIGFLDQLINDGIAPLATQIAESLAPLLPGIATSFDQIVTALGPLIPVLAQAFVQAVVTLAPLLPALVKALADMVTQFSLLVQNLPPSFMQALEVLFTTVLANPVAIGLVIVLAETLAAVFEALDNIVNGNFTKSLEPIYTFFYKLYQDTIKPIVDGLQKIADFSHGNFFTTTVPGQGVQVHGDGGRMQAGVPGIVGDLGPELFVPSVNGTIIPNNQVKNYLSGSGANITVVEAYDAQATAYTIDRHLRFAHS